MLIQTVGELLPVAGAVALSPFPVVSVVLVLGTPRGLAAGTALAVGWLVGLGAVTALAFAAAGEADAAARGLGPWMQIVVGGALLAAAAWKWRTRPRGSEPPKTPRWMASLDRVTPGRALLVGLALGVNPKNIALAVAGGAAFAELAVQGARPAAGVVVFVLLGSATVLGALLARAIGGERVAGPLDSVKRFMLENNNIIMMFVFLLIGLKILGDGLAGLRL